MRKWYKRILTCLIVIGFIISNLMIAKADENLTVTIPIDGKKVTVTLPSSKTKKEIKKETKKENAYKDGEAIILYKGNHVLAKADVAKGNQAIKIEQT